MANSNRTTLKSIAFCAASKEISRDYRRDLDGGPFRPMGDIWSELGAEKQSPRTIRTYVEAAQWSAAECLISAGLDDRG